MSEISKNIIDLDYPDPDVIRVGDTYYMVSTTMYFFPGCEILRSYDLLHWEHAGFVYDNLDNTPGQCLDDKKGIYGQGMWAATLRFHEGRFYIIFVCNDTHKTYLFTCENIYGPWQKSEIEGFYHDCSLLFDEDRVFLVYGNREIHLTELSPDLHGPKRGGIDKVIVKDSDKTPLAYEGSHFYKINGHYYIFLIHSLEDRWMRAEACFMADKVDGEYKGCDILANDLGYCGSGVAQGGIVDDPYGNFYAILFQDMGAVGRVPYLLKLEWKDDFPMIVTDPCPPQTIDLRPGYVYTPLVGSDDFGFADGPVWGLKPAWQFNHVPKPELFGIDDANHSFTVTTDRLCDDILTAVNTLTMRLKFPACHCAVTLDASALNVGDVAGLAVMQGAYAFVGVTRREDGLHMFMRERIPKENSVTSYTYEITEHDDVLIDSSVVRLSFDADFAHMKDEVRFNIGPTHKMYFKLDHFTGNRAALFMYSKEVTGGSASFSDFVLE